MRVGIATAWFLAAGCANFEESGLPGSASSMARNQMMMVGIDPPTFGYYRLTSLTRIYPDLGVFMNSHGTPDFLAETDGHTRNYFILYYLGKRQAFACRTRPGNDRMIDFAGPYPITEGEHRTLSGFRKRKVQ